MLGLGLLLLAIGLFLARRYYYSLLLFFGFITNGFQLIPSSLLMSGAPTDKSTDLALVFLLVALISRSQALWETIRREQLFRWLGIFVAFIAIDGVYSIVSEGYEISGVLRVFRVNLFLLSFGLFFVVPTPVLMRVFHVIAALTVIQSVLFLIQIPLNQTLLNSAMAGSEVATTTIDEFAFTRYYNTPVFLTPVVFYYLFQFRYRSKVMHFTVLTILLLAVIAPMHRNYIFTIALVSSVYVLFKQKRSKRAVYICIILVIGYGISLIDMVSYRIEEGISDFSKTFTTGQSLATTDYGSNTFAFRMAHLFERINYVTAKPSRYVFGLGLLSEDTKQAQRLSFEVGTNDKRTGQVTQINTGDIAWSLLILQLGFAGTILFVVLLVHIIRFFYRNQTIPFATVGLLTVVTTFITSFAGTELLMIPFRTLTVLMTVLVTKMIYNTYKSSIHKQSNWIEPLNDTLPTVTSAYGKTQRV